MERTIDLTDLTSRRGETVYVEEPPYTVILPAGTHSLTIHESKGVMTLTSDSPIRIKVEKPI